jgi:hypothetical protein
MATLKAATQRLRRRALPVAVSAMALVGIAALAAISGEPSKPGPIVPLDGASASSAADSAAPTVPAITSPPDGVTCPGGWTYFDNPVAHYGLCVPQAWGFSDFRRTERLDRIPVVQLENLHLLGNAFPWRPGTMPFDAVRQGAIDVELDVLPPAAQSGDECVPSTPKLIGALTVLTCEQIYGDDGLPAPSGLMRALKVIVPLATGPADEPGARLLVIARSRTWATLGEVTTLWQIVQHVHAY